VTAATQCHCMMFSRQIVIPILAKYPDARMKLLEHARQRLMALNEAIGVEPLRGFDQSGPVRATRLAGCAIGFGNVIQNADAHLFAASPIFQDARVDLLYELSNQMTTKHFEEGRTIIQQGVPFRGDTDFVSWISKGQVEVCFDGHFVAVLGEGDVFGELACFAEEGVRQATVRSKTRVILRQVKGAALKQILEFHEDKELMAKWEKEMERRWEQLASKENARKQMKQKPVHLDFMFLKLTDLSHGGHKRPKTAPLGSALYEMCGKNGPPSLPPIQGPIPVADLMA